MNAGKSGSKAPATSSGIWQTLSARFLAPTKCQTVSGKSGILQTASAVLSVQPKCSTLLSASCGAMFPTLSGVFAITQTASAQSCSVGLPLYVLYSRVMVVYGGSNPAEVEA